MTLDDSLLRLKFIYFSNIKKNFDKLKESLFPREKIIYDFERYYSDMQDDSFAYFRPACQK